jgi:squalene cyclase
LLAVVAAVALLVVVAVLAVTSHRPILRFHLLQLSQLAAAVQVLGTQITKAQMELTAFFRRLQAPAVVAADLTAIRKALRAVLVAVAVCKVAE